MLSRLTHYLIIGAVLGFFYILLSNHFLFFGYRELDDIERLEKTELTFKHTFCSIQQQSPEAVLRIDALREAGVGDLMVQRGMVSPEKLQQILMKIEVQQQ